MQNSSLLEPGNIRDAMCKVFAKILSCGILLVLGNHISYTSQLGIFENPNCLRCQQKVPQFGLLNSNNYEALIGILPMCTQKFFQTFCTRVIESTLLSMVKDMSIEYVFVFDF
jgi:hypothetical protein